MTTDEIKKMATLIAEIGATIDTGESMSTTDLLKIAVEVRRNEIANQFNDTLRKLAIEFEIYNNRQISETP